MKRFFVLILLTIMALPAADAIASEGCDAAAAGELDVTNWAGQTELDFAAWDTLIVRGQTFSNFGTGVILVDNVLVASDPFTNNDPEIVYTFPAHTTDTVRWSTLSGSSGGRIAWTLDCQPITPAPGTANIAVVNSFVDGNNEDSVVVTLTCTSGTISPSSAVLEDGEGQIFVVSNIPSGVANPCTLTQSVVSDYDTSYLCDPTATIAGDVQCGNPASLSSTSCSWADATADDVGYCAIYNAPAPVEFVVSKVWDVSNAGGGDAVNTQTAIEIYCNAEIVEGTEDAGEWMYRQVIAGDASVTVNVIPAFEGSGCWVAEPDVDSAVEVANGCTSVDIELGQAASCTITNTVFFEGIPTLNQYGLAIMALLMLGAGFVGFRRFV